MTLHLKPLISLTERVKSSPFTRNKIAEFVGVSRQTLWHWEQGTKIEKVIQVTRLAKVLGCKPDDLNSDLRDDP